MSQPLLLLQPLGFLHCSVVNSDNMEAFARQGNAFGKDFGGKNLSFRDFGSYAIAPPPDAVWADDQLPMEDDFETELVDADIFSMDFEEEEEAQTIGKNPMMPWYEQVDAIVATFPKAGNGPADDSSVMARLNGLKWLACQGESLPANVERVLVMDATDLADLPITNDDPNLPPGVDVESFWAATNRRPSRVLLRKGENAQAQAAAKAAARAAQAAADAAQAALEAMESGEAAEAAEASVKFQEAAAASASFVQSELAKAQVGRRLPHLMYCLVIQLNPSPYTSNRHSRLNSLTWVSLSRLSMEVNLLMSCGTWANAMRTSLSCGVRAVGENVESKPF